MYYPDPMFSDAHAWIAGAVIGLIAGFALSYFIARNCKSKLELEIADLMQYINKLISQARAIGNSVDDFQKKVNSDTADLVKRIHEHVDELTK